MKQVGNDTEFCGRIVVNQNSENTRMGCPTNCKYEDSCSDCNYDENLNISKRRSTDRSSPQKHSTSISRNNFLDFLKRQQQLNKIDGLDTKFKYMKDIDKLMDNNVNFNFDNDSNNVNRNRKMDCEMREKKKCYPENSCFWNKNNLLCEDLKVTFYTGQGLKNNSFKLKIGNYDRNDVIDFNFLPSYILIPNGLRVKIYEKSGFAGGVKGYVGNIEGGEHDEDTINKMMYSIDNIGSLQICNMRECSKPSEYQNMKLVSVINSDNIDTISKNSVGSMEEYRENLQNSILNLLKLLEKTHSNCLDNLSTYLKANDINLDDDVSLIKDIYKLQRLKNILETVPSCEHLAIFNGNISRNNINRINNIEKEKNDKKNKIILISSIVIILIIILLLVIKFMN